MKFKRLNEAFDYDQAAINDATALINDLSDFIDNISIYRHAYECIDSEELAALGTAIEVLTTFRLNYMALASKNLKDYYNKG